MRLIRSLVTCAVLLLLCGTAAMAQSVQTDWDRTFNLSKLRTYSEGVIELQQPRSIRIDVEGRKFA
jgi:hypothetical protein